MSKRLFSLILAWTVWAMSLQISLAEPELLPTFDIPKLQPGEGYELSIDYTKAREWPEDPDQAVLAKRLAEANPRLLKKQVRRGQNQAEIQLSWENGAKTRLYQHGVLALQRRPWPPDAAVEIYDFRNRSNVPSLQLPFSELALSLIHI